MTWKTIDSAPKDGTMSNQKAVILVVLNIVFVVIIVVKGFIGI